MNRRSFVAQSALALAFSSFYPKGLLGNMLLQNPYQFKTLRNGVGYFTEQGGTIGWLHNAAGIVVVDAQFPNSAAHAIAELKKLGEQPFELLLNTHHHGDHTSGNIAFKGLVKKLIAHQNSAINQRMSADKAKTTDKQYFPDDTFERVWKTSLGNTTIQGYYFGAAHTNGDVIYHFEDANVVHMGDLMFNRRYPFIDRTYGAYIGNWITVLDTIGKKFDNDTQYIFGHSLDPEKVIGNKNDILAFKNYLQRLLDFTKREMNAGKTLEDLLKTTSIPGAEEWKGDGIERSIKAAYEELS